MADLTDFGSQITYKFDNVLLCIPKRIVCTILQVCERCHFLICCFGIVFINNFNVDSVIIISLAFDLYYTVDGVCQVASMDSDHWHNSVNGGISDCS